MTDVYGDRPSDETLAYLRQLVGFDRDRTHERKNETPNDERTGRAVRAALSERMRLAETASEWLEQL